MVPRFCLSGWQTNTENGQGRKEHGERIPSQAIMEV